MSSSCKKLTLHFGKTPGSQPRPPVDQARRQSVLLTDWWLIEVESNPKERRLGVAGFSSRGREATRQYKSAAIIKRHDQVNLESEDGVTIELSNGMNLSKTLANGFSPEVCNHFLSGFPYYWKEFSGKCIGGESAHKTGPSQNSSINGITISPDVLPVATVRDILMLSSGDSVRCLVEKCISSHIPRTQVDNAVKQDVSSARTNGKHKRQGDDTDVSSRLVADLSEHTSNTQAGSKAEEKSKGKGSAPCSAEQSRYCRGRNFPKRESSSKTGPSGTTSVICFATSSINDISTSPADLPVAHLRDNLMHLREGCLSSPRAGKQGDNAVKKNASSAKTKGKRRRQEHDQLVSGHGTLKTLNASKVEEKSNAKGGSLCSTNGKEENTPKDKTTRGNSVGEIASGRVTTRSMRKLSNSGTNLMQI